MNNLRKGSRTRVVSGALLAMALALYARNATAAVRYVDVNSTNPVAPYYSWSTATRTIQEAVDVAIPGDEILVNDGSYQTGGSILPGSLETNRVAVTKAVAIRSVSGPAFTTIRGFHDETRWVAPTNMEAWVRCVYLGAGASLSGFTLTNGGAATKGGGILCETNTALLFDCVIMGNRALDSGGGVSGGTLNDCTLANNRAGTGGGADGSTLNYCTLSGNSAGWFDGVGVNLGSGGGAARSVLNSCIVSNNGTAEGGGVSWSTVHNSLIVENGAGFGAGAIHSTLLNCTVANNYGGATHGKAGVGISDCVATNCIIVNNWSEWEGLDNVWLSTLSYSCTSPMPTNGVGNITGAPLFVNASGGDFRLQPGSAGIDAGTDPDLMVTRDLAGVPRPLDGNQDGVAAFDMGAYEFALLLNSVRYVNVSNATPSPPFLTWATAARTIQEAVDVAMPGDEILVTNGVYEIGGRVVPGYLDTNRVAVTIPVAVRSVQGPAFTTIRGFNDPTSNDLSTWVRCVYLGAGASLSGFTLAGGGTASDGGGVKCESKTSVLSNCVLIANLAQQRGGATVGGTLNNCTLKDNRSGCGAGAYDSILKNCTISDNAADGVSDVGILFGEGGGAVSSILNNCVLSGNYGGDVGGGALDSTLVNCTLVSNGALLGGGAFSSTLVHCTVVNNVSGAILSGSPPSGGGVYDCMVTNSIVYYNSDALLRLDNHARSALSYSCITPLPTNGWGNITGAPLFVNAAGGDFRLQPGSAGIDAGTDPDLMVTHDLAGVPRPLDGNQDGVAAFDMGAYEFALLLNSVRYVNVSNATPSPPFLTWATAARTIQEAVDAAMPGDEILVTNGVYEIGGRVVPGYLDTNRVAVTIPVAVRSVQGPAFTTIRGYHDPTAPQFSTSVRCVYLAAGASLTGFTLMEGGAESGGGAYSKASTATLSDCVLVNNSAIGGGGAYGGTLINCLLNSNRAGFFGKGAFSSILIGCTVVNNDGSPFHIVSGAVLDSVVINCIVVNNRTSGGGFDNFINSELSYSCTSPMPTNGVGNITNAPLFLDAAGGDFRLQPRSPCIDGGMDLSSVATKDLAGLRRGLDGNGDGIAGFDMGAYEFNPLFLTSISKVGPNLRVCWFDHVPGMRLQTTPAIGSGTWSDLAVPSNATCMELPLTSSNMFFRLSLP